MSAETLRRAADLMRERAEGAIGQAGAHWSRNNAGNGLNWLEPAHIGMHGYGRTVEHIASWHPVVALAVADSLDQAAAILEESDGGPLGMAMRAIAEPLVDVALTYLGESA